MTGRRLKWDATVPSDAIDDFMEAEATHTCHEGQWATPAQETDHCPRCQWMLGNA